MTTALEAQRLFALLTGADHNQLGDHSRAAGLNLDLAEARLERTIRQDGSGPALEVLVAGTVRAHQALARGEVARACVAVTDAVRAVIGTTVRR